MFLLPKHCGSYSPKSVVVVVVMMMMMVMVLVSSHSSHESPHESPHESQHHGPAHQLRARPRLWRRRRGREPWRSHDGKKWGLSLLITGHRWCSERSLCDVMLLLTRWWHFTSATITWSCCSPVCSSTHLEVSDVTGTIVAKILYFLWDLMPFANNNFKCFNKLEDFLNSFCVLILLLFCNL